MQARRRASTRGSVAAEIGLGLAASVIGVGLIGQGVQALEMARKPATPAIASSAAIAPDAAPLADAALGDATALSSPDAGSPPSSPVAPIEALGEPPREIGPRYDDDSNLPPPPAPIASYELNARLDADAHVIAGHGTIRWTNPSSKPADELWLHLYLNAYKNSRTLFLRSRLVAARGGEQPTEFGFVDVKKLIARELGGVDVWPRAERHSPGDRDDQTDIRVPLPAMVEGGKTLTLEIEFESKLPAVTDRTGYAGRFHFAGQWFPKLAVREPDGTWAHFAFHPLSEFYADYGRYSVTIDVPESMKVGATGPRVAEKVEHGRRIVRHEIDGVHDFAWTAWDRFVEKRERIDGIDVVLLHPPEHESNARATLDALRFALPHFRSRYGKYPYPVLTVVHPPEAARDAGGMEYPTLITTGSPWWTSVIRLRTVENVTVHELGHQWFYGLLASDEHSWPFLDEGVNSYAESVALDERWGASSLIAWPGLELSYESIRHAFAAAEAENEAVAKPAADFSSFDEIGALVYCRTAVLMRMLGSVYGEDRLRRALGRYARRHRFSHPRPQHLLAAIREVMGDEPAELMRAALFDRASVDYVVDDVRSVRWVEPVGVYDEPGGARTTKKPAPADAMAPQRWITRVLVHRRGALRLPVDVDLIAADGTAIRRHWDGQGEFSAFEHDGPSEIVAAVVDPELRIGADESLLNNALSTRPHRSPRVLERITYVAELLLGYLGP